MLNLKCLMFDVDGTLANTEEAHRKSFNYVFTHAGLDWDWDQALYKQLLRISGGVERMLHYADTRQLKIPSDDPVDFVKNLHRQKTAYYNQLLQSGEIKLRTGVERIIREARQADVRLAITTTTTRVNVETLLQVNLGSESLAWFDAWVCGEEVKHKKPDPEVYTMALQLLNVKASQSIAFEDSYNGVRAACAAGIPCLVTPNPYTDGDDFSGAFMVVDTLGDTHRHTKSLQGMAPPSDYIQLVHLNDALQHL